jgi:hypothetical protein
LPSVAREQFAGGEDLCLARSDNPRSRDESIACGWAQAIDTEVCCEYRTNNCARCIAAGGVDQCGDEACVKEAGVLPRFLAPGHGDLYKARGRGHELQIAPAIEGGGLVEDLQFTKQVAHG